MIRDQIADIRRDVQETLKNCRLVLNAEEIGDLCFRMSGWLCSAACAVFLVDTV